jgi:hypothetical protein
VTELPPLRRLVLAPDEFLLLAKEDGTNLTAEEAVAIQIAVPPALRDRVLIMSGMTATVVKKEHA